MEREYSTYCSLSRESTSEAQNDIIAIDVIDSHNCMRKRMRSSRIRPNTSMMEFYTDAKVATLSLIKFSRLLPSYTL